MSQSAVAPWAYQDNLKGLLFGACFTTREVANPTVPAGKTAVAAFFPITAKAIMAALDAQNCVVLKPIGTGIVAVGTTAGMKNPPAVLVKATDAIRAALLGGHVLIDADAAMKLGGNRDAPTLAATDIFVAIASPALGPVADMAFDPDNAQPVAPTPSAAVFALRPTTPGMSYVLLAAQGESL